YCLPADINGAGEQATLLADLLFDWRRHAHVNLIPYNSIGAGLSGTVYRRPDEDQLTRFIETLRAHRIVAHFRRTRGDDVAGACGQLRQSIVPLTVAQSR